MFLTTDTTALLARARNDGLSLASAKEGGDEPAPNNDKVGSTFESLAAVIPTGITAIYTGAVLILRGVALARGTDERAELQAGWVKAGKTPEEITKLLKNLPLETGEWLTYRWLLLFVAGIAAVVFVARAAFDGNGKAKKKRKPIRVLLAEPLTAAIAFAGWSLASPGTPMGAEMNADDLLVFTAVVGAIAAMSLFAMGRLTLAKAANTVPDQGGAPPEGDE